MTKELLCWCGNENLDFFSSDYLLCGTCGTLVLSERPNSIVFQVEDDDKDYYGKRYYEQHLTNDYGYPDLTARTRSDLSERCIHWLKILSKYKLPPSNVLELGSAHGGFPFLLKSAGFGANGLELSPWLVNYAKKTFDIPMYLGKVEDQIIDRSSLDSVVLMDVLEHLPDPVNTIKLVKDLLKDDGILVIQTPCYPEGKSFNDLQSLDDPFLKQFKPTEHLFLFSQTSIQQFLHECKFSHIYFEPAFFGMYDMFLVASPTPLQVNTQEAIDQALMSTPSGRLVLALLDKDAECKGLTTRLQESEHDRAARLGQVNQYDIWLKESQRELKESQRELKESQRELKESQRELEKITSSPIYKLGKKVGIF